MSTSEKQTFLLFCLTDPNESGIIPGSEFSQNQERKTLHWKESLAHSNQTANKQTQQTQ
jgi:hypothetical protein